MYWEIDPNIKGCYDCGCYYFNYVYEVDENGIILKTEILDGIYSLEVDEDGVEYGTIRCPDNYHTDCYITSLDEEYDIVWKQPLNTRYTIDRIDVPKLLIK